MKILVGISEISDFSLKEPVMNRTPLLRKKKIVDKLKLKKRKKVIDIDLFCLF